MSSPLLFQPERAVSWLYFAQVQFDPSAPCVVPLEAEPVSLVPCTQLAGGFSQWKASHSNVGGMTERLGLIFLGPSLRLEVQWLCPSVKGSLSHTVHSPGPVSGPFLLLFEAPPRSGFDLLAAQTTLKSLLQLLKKTLESPLDSKEINPLNPEGNQL